MVANGTVNVQAAAEVNYDRTSELKAFDDTKAGVKGLVDGGITEIPRIFIQPKDSSDNISNAVYGKFTFPVIDLGGIDKDPIQLKETVEKIRDASEKWGFFLVVNHGIPVTTLEEMRTGVCRFHDQDTEERKKWYTRDSSKSLVYQSNFDLYKTPAANWRDTMYCTMAPNPPKPEDLPEVCRDILVDYSKQVTKLGITLFELLSQGLGLNPDYLKDIDCAEGLALVCQYYPSCPQPELTIGTRTHSDNNFITVLLQDDIGGLQVLHQNQWVDVPPTPGAIVVNIGDLLQLISNDKFISVQHRVLANRVGPRVSVAAFFNTGITNATKLYAPIKELLTEDCPAKYRATSVKEYVQYFRDAGVTDSSILSHFKIWVLKFMSH